MYSLYARWFLYGFVKIPCHFHDKIPYTLNTSLHILITIYTNVLKYVFKVKLLFLKMYWIITFIYNFINIFGELHNVPVCNLH